MSENNGALAIVDNNKDKESQTLELKVNFNKMSPKKRLCVDILASNGFDIADASERLKKTQKTIRGWWKRDQNFRNAIVVTHSTILGIDKLKRNNINKLIYERLSSELVDRVSNSIEVKMMEVSEIVKILQYVDKSIRLDTPGDSTEKIASTDIKKDIEQRFEQRQDIDKLLINMVPCRDEEGNLHYVRPEDVDKNGLKRIE